MHPIPYSVWWAPQGAAVVTMPAEIDLANCDQVHAALVRAVESGPAVVIADLTGTSYCGYAGTATLVNVHVRAAESGGRLRLAVPALQARLIRKIAGTRHSLDCYPDLTAALAGPRARDQGAAGPRLTLVPGQAVRSPGSPVLRLRIVPPASQAPPPGPSPTSA